MSLISLFLKPAEHSLNRVLLLDPETPKRLQPLAGKVLMLEITGADIGLAVEFTEQGLRLSQGREEADAAVRGSAMALLAVAMEPEQGGGGHVEFTGDVGVVQKVRAFFAGLEIDWEEHLSHVTGDAVAHQVGNITRGLQHWSRRNTRIFGENLAEYLTEERRELPPRAEAEDFMRAVSRLRQDGDRLAARIAQLEQRLENKDEPSR